MFNPFSRTRTPGFHVRPQDDLPGFRLGPEEEVPGFAIDENGRPRPRPFPDSQIPVQPAPPPATVDPFGPDWLRRLLALPQPRSWTPSGLRWPPAQNLPVGPTGTSATPPEPDEPDAAFQGSGPDATNSAAALPWDDGQLHPQAGVSGPWVRSPGTPPLPAAPSSADPNVVLANADDDGVEEAQRQTKPPAPSRAAQGRTPPAPGPQTPGMEMTESERRREQEFADFNNLWRHQTTWDRIIRTPPPPDNPSYKVPNQLPDNWEEYLGGIDSRYPAWTRAAAEHYNIPPELLARLLYQESKYDKNAANGTALGIAQLTPGAVKSVGRDPRTFNYDDPQASIDAAAAYLAQQYRQFKDWPKAVAAYNAGAGRLQGWLGGKGEDPSAKEQQPHWWREMNTHLQQVFRGRPDYFDK